MKPRLLVALATISVSALIVSGLLMLWLGSRSNAAIQNHYAVEVAFPNLVFDAPVGIYNAGDGSNRLFVVEQAGLIKVFEDSTNATVDHIFLDIRSKVLYGDEMGLLGLAFHPSFSENGYFYVDYVTDNPRRSIISRFSVLHDNPNTADINSEFILMQIEQPYPNHKGGQLAFGPDGYLYIALGDGGGAGDPLGNGQNRSTLLGSILRINVNQAAGGLNYTIPVDNPFVGNTNGYREEIYAYGLRNPWRFSFDSATEWLWAGDVGQDRIEEIDIIESGKNYGWNIMEGSLCYSPSSGCNQTGLTLPIWEYNHSLGDAVIGGFVYHGLALPELAGKYVYGDYGSGRIWALQYDGTSKPVNTELVDTDLNIPSFGQDENNDLFFCAFDGRIYQLTIDDISPVIGNPSYTPQDPTPNQQVKVTVNVTDDLSGVREVILSYATDDSWANVTMTPSGGDAYAANITSMSFQTTVHYMIIAYDNSNNTSVNDNSGSFYSYTVIPEFQLSAMLLLTLVVISFVVLCQRRQKTKRSGMYTSARTNSK